MKLTSFEKLDAWLAAREMVKAIYRVSGEGSFARDFSLQDQIRRAAGSVMHNIAEGFDSGGNKDFLRFLRYSHRSCSEVRSQLYVALDCGYIDQSGFDHLADLTSSAAALVGGLIRYLKSREAN